MVQLPGCRKKKINSMMDRWRNVKKICINDGERQLRFTVTGGGENSLAYQHLKCSLLLVPIDYK